MTKRKKAKKAEKKAKKKGGDGQETDHGGARTVGGGLYDGEANRRRSFPSYQPVRINVDS